MKITLKTFLALLNTGAAIFFGWFSIFLSLIEIGTSSNATHQYFWNLIILVIVILTGSIISGWLIALKSYHSFLLKFVAILPVPFYLYFSYSLISRELNYRYSDNDYYCIEMFSNEYERPIFQCEQLKKNVGTGVIFYKDPITGKKLAPPAPI